MNDGLFGFPNLWDKVEEFDNHPWFQAIIDQYFQVGY